MVVISSTNVGPVGYGLMGFMRPPVPMPTEEAVEVIHSAVASGIRFLNGGEFYGTPEYNSLHLIKAYFTKYPEHADKVIISIKGAFDMSTGKPRGDEEGVKKSVDECLRVLDDKKKLDLFECARVDPDTPIEESIRVLSEYVKAGKLGGISLSEVSASSIERAARVHQISAVEIEYSLFATEAEHNGVLRKCAELSIPVVAYSPLGRGFLTGAISSPADVPPMLRRFPRFADGNFERNMKLVWEVEKMAKKKGVSMTQIALAWVKFQSGSHGMPQILPIPGATTKARNEENFADVELTEAEFQELQDVLKRCCVFGDRYPPGFENYSFA